MCEGDLIYNLSIVQFSMGRRKQIQLSPYLAIQLNYAHSSILFYFAINCFFFLF
jgi:hypothetical protein